MKTDDAHDEASSQMTLLSVDSIYFGGASLRLPCGY